MRRRPGVLRLARRANNLLYRQSALGWGWKIRAKAFRRIEFIERICAQYERFGSVAYSECFEWPALKWGALGSNGSKTIPFRYLPIYSRENDVISRKQLTVL
jgi:hypothetical protein